MSNHSWQRLSPISSVYYLLKLVKNLVSQAIPTFSPMAIVIFNSDDKGAMAIMIALALSVILLCLALLQYWFFRYRLDNTDVLINQGVFKKQHRVINFDRVQNINIERPIYFRPFKLVTLVIETAGSKGGEGDLAGISQHNANLIRDLILANQSQLKSNEQHGDDLTPTSLHSTTNLATNPTTAPVVANASLSDLCRYGLSNNSAFLLLALLAPFFAKIQSSIAQSVNKDDVLTVANLLGGAVIGSIVLVLLLIASLFLFFSLISVMGAILRFYNYQLTLCGSTLKRKSGLVNTHEESLNLSKIQAIARQSNFVSHWLKRENLVLRQTTSNSNQAQKRSSTFIVPARTHQQSQQICQLIYPGLQQDITTQHIDRRYVLKTLLLTLTLPFILLSAPIILTTQAYLWLLSWLALPLMMYPLVVKRWQQYRYGNNQQYAVVCSGFIGRKRVAFEFFKVQRAVISQSYLQKKRRLATLNIYLASGRLRIPYMPIEQAQYWFDWIYLQTETDARPWF